MLRDNTVAFYQETKDKERSYDHQLGGMLSELASLQAQITEATGSKHEWGMKLSLLENHMGTLQNQLAQQMRSQAEIRKLRTDLEEEKRKRPPPGVWSQARPIPAASFSLSEESHADQQPVRPQNTAAPGPSGLSEKQRGKLPEPPIGTGWASGAKTGLT